MTNAEKYKEVFGLTVDPSMCPTTDCDVCPCCAKDSKGNVSCVSACTYEWWNKEYKGGTVNCKDCDGYEAGYSAGLKDAENRSTKQ